MKFNKFSSIEHSYREKYIAIIREHSFDTVRWIVSEKIDGANFSFIADNESVVVASRNELTNGDFYHCQTVIDRDADKVLHLKQAHFGNATQIQVYGELHGPGIQSKVDYGDLKDFAAFEIQSDGTVIDACTTSDLLRLSGIPMPPAMGVFDNLDTVLALSSIFKSRVFPDASGDNVAEGLVMKPVEPLYLNNGKRVIIKNKNPKFAEKKKKKKTFVENPWVDIAAQYVTQNRLDAVLSKEGSLELSDFGKVIRLMSMDVIVDMIKDGDLPDNWKKLDECKLAGKGVAVAVGTFLKARLLHRL